MSDKSAALLLLRKIMEQADMGAEGSGDYAKDRLRHIKTLADMARRKIEATE